MLWRLCVSIVGMCFSASKQQLVEHLQADATHTRSHAGLVSSAWRGGSSSATTKTRQLLFAAGSDHQLQHVAVNWGAHTCMQFDAAAAAWVLLPHVGTRRAVFVVGSRVGRHEIVQESHILYLSKDLPDLPFSVLPRSVLPCRHHPCDPLPLPSLYTMHLSTDPQPPNPPPQLCVLTASTAQHGSWCAA